jgi:RNA polymerase sigma factor (sigma-70 family)
MAGETTIQIQSLLDRLRNGDLSARRPLTERAFERLRRNAALIFRRSFPDFQGRHDPDGIMSDLWIKLDKALESVRPATPAEYFGLARKKTWEVLYDLAVQERQRWGLERPFPPQSEADVLVENSGSITYDPVRLEQWNDFHRFADTLVGDEKLVFDMHWYGDITEAEIARELGLSPKKVSRLWIAATERLADRLPGFDFSS